jgi:predicted Zn-dependent protease
VAIRVVGEDFRAIGMTPSVRVLSNVDMNAFAFANGIVYVHTSMLARMENEAQLATLLAHEFSHTIYRHALRQRRDIKNKTAWMSSLAVVVGGLPLAPILLQLGTVSSMLGYSRELEREADLEGFKRLVAAGYLLSEAPRLFEITTAYQRELQAQGVPEPEVPYFFSTHPKMQERIEDYRRLVAKQSEEGASVDHGLVNTDIYQQKTRGARLHQAGLELAAGRHDSARITAERVIEDSPGDAAAWSMKGRAHASEGMREDARSCFRQALEFDASLPDPHHALGMSFYREWLATPSRASAETAVLHLDRYLELQPNAADRGYIAAYIRELKTAIDGEAPRSSAGAPSTKENSP